jgi:signal transduction histidine kinase
MNILIADDDSVSRHFLQYYLQKWGYEVTAAQDGAEAWRLFEGGLFPMVITDWMMPEMDGSGLLRRIRASQRPGYVYAILLTARSQKQDLVEGMEAGADDFLTKPFDRDELRVRLRAGERIIRLEHHLRETQAALIQNEQLASLGRLAAGVAHEIDTAEGLRRIRAIVQNLRDFARLDEAQSKEVELSTALESTLSALRHELDQKALRVTTDYQQSPPVACHPGKINQMFFNILLNAIQASTREGLLEVRIRPDNESAVVVEIEDHGCGISPEHLPHIFERFFTTKPVGEGTGLGLSVSYGIVRDHGGSLEVESHVGLGSVFRIRLPLEPPKTDFSSEPAQAR